MHERLQRELQSESYALLAQVQETMRRRRSEPTQSDVARLSCSAAETRLVTLTLDCVACVMALGADAAVTELPDRGADPLRTVPEATFDPELAELAAAAETLHGRLQRIAREAMRAAA